MANLLDVNVLVALMHGNHMHSPVASAWLDGITERNSLLLCRVVQMGALRISTSPAAFGNDPLSALEAWRQWESLEADSRFVWGEEHPNMNQAWKPLTSAFKRGRIAGTDSYLAAFALAGGHSLVTFDRGFAGFPGLQVELLG